MADKRQTPKEKIERETRFVQRSGGRRVSLAIDNEGVDYEFREQAGERRFRIDHEQIDPAPSTMIDRKARSQARMLLLLVTIVLLAFLHGSIQDVAAVVALAGIAGLTIALLRNSGFVGETAYTIFHCKRGNLYILQDKQHDAILAELNARRVGSLRRKYLTINQENAPGAELNKYRWLRQLGAITDLELGQFEAVLTADEGSQQLRPQPPTISMN